jgi:imidazolonepropionase-like amidohydrolase
MMLPLLLALTGGVAPAETLTVSTDRLYARPGEVLENVVVTVTDGKITAVAPGRVDGDDGLHVAAITAGMVDLSSRINTGERSVEETEEVTPQYRVADSLDLFDRAWDRQLRHGVTTVVASPYDNNCIGGLSVALKTGGEPTLEARLVKHDVALRGAFGSQPSSKNHPAYGRPTDFYSRRPTTRMGVEWTWRKAFYDALYAAGRPERAFAGVEQLSAALEGELPVFAQAWATQDIRTAVFLKEEMAGEGRPKMRLIIDCGAEAWREPEMLVRTGTAVVLPPLPGDGRSGDGALYTATAASKLHEAGVPLALSSHNSGRSGSFLGDQAALARRGGLPFDAALAAVTITPARMVGVDDRVGTVEVGKDGDLALWNGTPFELSSKVVGVVLDGNLVIDPR